MNAGISAHFSPTIKSERDKWLRYRVNFNPSGTFVAGVGPFRGGMFFKSVSYGRLSSAYSWLNSYIMEVQARETNDNTAR